MKLVTGLLILVLAVSFYTIITVELKVKEVAPEVKVLIKPIGPNDKKIKAKLQKAAYNGYHWYADAEYPVEVNYVDEINKIGEVVYLDDTEYIILETHP